MFYHRIQTFRQRLRDVFFGPAYHPANHAALTARGTRQQIRLVLLATGAVWVSFLLFDCLGRGGQPFPKSLRFAQGANVLSEPANRVQQPDELKGNIAQILSVKILNAPYLAAEDKAPRYLSTDAFGFRRVHSVAPFEVLLSGDSFFTNEVLADTLARAAKLAVGNAAIKGQGVLSMARLLSAPAPVFQHAPKILIWGRAERDIAKEEIVNGVAQYRSDLKPAASRSQRLYQQWHQSAAWPANIEGYLNETSTLSSLFTHLAREFNWHVRQRYDNRVVLGRTDLPAGVAPMEFMQDEKSLTEAVPSNADVEQMATAIAAIAAEWQQRGTTLYFTMPPEKSTIYSARLPIRQPYHPGFAQQLYTALRRRNVHTIDLTPGLRQAAHHNPTHALYYSTDTHWNLRGATLAAHILADSILAKAN